jgi:hypothetical protein
MALYVIASGWLGRPLHHVAARDGYRLRREVRKWLGLRGSARLRYRQIGTNSFLVETRWGWPVVQVYRA